MLTCFVRGVYRAKVSWDMSENEHGATSLPELPLLSEGLLDGGSGGR